VPQRLSNLARMLRAERLPPPAIERMQAQHLRALVCHAGHRVPAYRDLWRAHGVDPRAIRGVADLAHLPVIDKDTIRDMGIDRFIDERIADRSVLLPRSTSGSNGKPFEFFVDRVYDKWRKAQRLRPYVTNGLRPWQRSLVLTYDERTRALAGKLGAFRERRVYAARAPADIAQILGRMRPDALMGYPSSLGLLAAHCLETGGPPHRPRLVFSDSEVLTAATRARVRAAFGVDPIDVYGTFESDNTAFQCSARTGLHVAMESVIVEVVASGAAVPPGQTGEVVVTVLRNYAMPFIRYNLHDLGAYMTSPCICGRTLKMLARIEGRRDDYVRLADGRRCAANPLLVDIDAQTQWLQEYRVVQRGLGDFILYVSPTATFAADASRSLYNIVAKHVPGARTEVVVCPRGIPRDPSGKLRAFISEVRE
jgi:phenylacetate-CoA ligase